MYKKTMVKAAFVLGVAGCSVGVSFPSFAAAFQIWEQGASIGLYHAGGAAIADDATTDYYNSAGLTRLTKPQLSVGAANVTTHIRFKGTVTHTPQTIAADGGDSNIIPNLHYAHPLTDKTVFGFSMTMPLGLDTNYSEDNPVRYAGTKSKLEAFNISPSFGFKMNEKLSLGVGVDVQKLEAEFNQHVKLGGEELNYINKFDHWGYGYHLGLLYQFDPHTRVGFSYRSKINHHARGTSTLNHGTQPLFVNHNSSVDLVMPAMAILSAYHDFNTKFSLMGSVSYIFWGVFDDLTLKDLAAPTKVDIDVPQHFRNTWNFSVGGIYHVNPRFDLRASVGYDQTPVRNEYRTLQVPDSNREVIGLGAKYNVTKAFSIEGGWEHIFIHKSDVNSTLHLPTGDVIVNGMVDPSADVLGLQFNYIFG